MSSWYMWMTKQAAAFRKTKTNERVIEQTAPRVFVGKVQSNGRLATEPSVPRPNPSQDASLLMTSPGAA